MLPRFMAFSLRRTIRSVAAKTQPVTEVAPITPTVQTTSEIVRNHVGTGLQKIVKQPQYRLIEERVFADDLCKVSLAGSEPLPVIMRKPDSVLTKYWWSESPFQNGTELLIPVLRLDKNNTSTEGRQVIQLEPLIFNQPIRRDIVHRVLHWSLMHGKRTTHRTRTISEVAGSGKKPRPQKGMGAARLGNKRASGRRKGGKIFGHVPKDFTYEIPHKIKIRGLISCLSAKLAEGKVRIVDSEIISSHKTRDLSKLFPRVGHKEVYLFVVPKLADRNFMLASRSVDFLKVVNSNEVNVKDLLKFDKVVFTVQSLHEMSQILLAWLYWLEKPKAVKNDRIEKLLNLKYSTVQPDHVAPVYDPQSNWEPRFQILKDYYKQYKDMRKEDVKSQNSDRQQEESAGQEGAAKSS